MENFRGTRKNWQSMAILRIDLFYGTVHPIKFQANSWSWPILEISKSRGTRKNWQSMAILNSNQTYPKPNYMLP